MKCLHGVWTAVAAVGLSGCLQASSVVLEPLRVITWAPASGSDCVETDVEILVVFSDDVDEATLTAENLFLSAGSTTVPTTITYDAANFTARMLPVDELAFNTSHTAVATPGLTGKNTGALPVELDSSFQTVARQGCVPQVDCQIPTDCPDDQICRNGECRDECAGDQDCTLGACVDGVCEYEPAGGGGGDTDSAGGDP